MLTFTDKPMEKKISTKPWQKVGSNFRQPINHCRTDRMMKEKEEIIPEMTTGLGSADHRYRRRPEDRSSYSGQTCGDMRQPRPKLPTPCSQRDKTHSRFTAQKYCREIFQQYFSEVRKKVNFFWEMLTQVFRKKQTTASNSGNGRDNHRHVLLHFN